MKPLRIRARNLRTWDTLDLDIPEGIAAIVGPNGAGKSTLVSVIDLALFAGRGELKRAMTRGADDVEVSVDFLHGGERYRVARSWKGKPRLDFMKLETVDVTGYQHAEPQFIEGARPLSRETIDETEAAIEDLLGLTRQTFRASSYLAQGDGAAFTQADPRDRKAILLDALGVRIWDRLHEQAKGLRREEEESLNRVLALVEDAEGQLALRDAALARVAEAEVELAPAEMQVVDLEQGLAELQGEMIEAREHDAERRVRAERVERARQRAVEAEEEVARLRGRVREELPDRETFEVYANAGPLLTEVETLTREVAEKSRAATNLEQMEAAHAVTAADAERQVDNYVEHVARLDEEAAQLRNGDARCPTCKQPLGPEALAEALRVVQVNQEEYARQRDEQVERARKAAERATAARGDLDKTNDEIGSLVAQVTAAAAELPAGATREKVEQATVGLAKLAAAQERRAEDLDALAEAEEALPLRLREARDAWACLDDVPVADLAALLSREESAKMHLAGARERVRGADHRLAAATAEVKRLDDLAEDVKVKRQAIDETKEALAVFKLAEEAFGRDGVPALILEAQAVPQLEAEATRIIEELGRPYRFSLRTQRETQAGTAKEVLDIFVETPTGEAVYEDFSGGERTRLDLALRISLARLLAARRGADVRVLVVDEPSFLDAEGFAQLASVLRGVAQEFESVLVVSHEEALRDAFDSAIVIAGGGDSGEPSRLEGAR